MAHAAIAFFDLDNTLLAVNSARLWVRRERAHGRLGRWQVLRAAAWMLGYELGFAALEDAVERAIASLEGSLESDLRSRTRSFYEEEVRRHFRPGAREALREHLEAGDMRVLLTSSSNYLAELVAKELGLDAFISNHFEVDPTGRHTGRARGGVCFGAGKLVHAEAFAHSSGLPLSGCAFYTDSYSDLPVLHRVGRPVAVNPDRRLRRYALRRGWRVLDWGVPPADRRLSEAESARG
ncbi:MAG: HAD family hydrolase [Myxococcales bacterium]|nr:HAD family hydrolase [Myxococcales bacterium]